MEDQLYQSQVQVKSQSLFQRNEELENFIAGLSSSKMIQILQKFNPAELFQQMSHTELQSELCDQSKLASPDDPLSYVKDLSCLIDTVTENEDEGRLSNDEQVEVLSLPDSQDDDSLPTEMALNETVPIDIAQQVMMI